MEENTSWGASICPDTQELGNSQETFVGSYPELLVYDFVPHTVLSDTHFDITFPRTLHITFGLIPVSFHTKLCSFVITKRQFKYLEMTVTNQNSIQEEINGRLNSGNAYYYSAQNLICSRSQFET
jgi:hypothetical protein